jgi:hypothetical protein
MFLGRGLVVFLGVLVAGVVAMLIAGESVPERAVVV